ncbi:MAG: Na+/H+ antiporter subunit E [bacterium]
MRKIVVAWALLGVVWIVLTGTLAPAVVVPGLIVSAVAVLLCRPLLSGVAWLGYRERLRHVPESEQGLMARLRRVGWLLLFVPVFLWKIVLSGVNMALLALRPDVDFWPGIVRVEGGFRTTTGTTLFASLLTLTPGTLTIDYEETEDVLYVHWIDITGYGEADFDTRVTSGLRRWMHRIGA